MNRTLKILCSIPKTVWFNFRYLPLGKAVRLPVWLAPNVRVKSMYRGGMTGALDKTGLLHIGYHEADAVDVYAAHTILDVRKGGVLEFAADAHIGQGALLCVNKKGKLRLGKHFAISGTTSIVCSEEIRIGDEVQFSWNTLVMDSDAHHILDEQGRPLPNSRPISIGSHVWIAANCTLLKGTVVPDHCVVGANSLLTGHRYDENSVIVGNPARSVKRIGGWKI